MVLPRRPLSALLIVGHTGRSTAQGGMELLGGHGRCQQRPRKDVQSVAK